MSSTGSPAAFNLSKARVTHIASIVCNVAIVVLRGWFQTAPSWAVEAGISRVFEGVAHHIKELAVPINDYS